MLSLRTYLLLAFFVLTIMGCKRKLMYGDYMDYIKDSENGLVQVKVINGVQMKVTYRPTELWVLQELHGRDSISKEDIKEAYERYGQQYYFILSLSYGGKEILSNAYDRNRFSMLVRQFAFNMDQSVVLTTEKKDTLQILDSHYARMYATTPSTDILFAFERSNKRTRYIELRIDEFGLNTGNTSFRFAWNDLKNTPQLIFYNNK